MAEEGLVRYTLVEEAELVAYKARLPETIVLPGRYLRPQTHGQRL